MRLVLLGAPGSGKGTQAQRLRDEKGIPQVSSGDLLRDAVKRGTDLGKRARAAMDAGELVSDEIVLGLIRERLGRPDARRIHTRRFRATWPRPGADAARRARQPIDAVVLMDVDPAVLFKRLTGRRTCPNCGKVFNIYTAPSRKGERCDNCETSPVLVQRDDDREEVIDKRLRVYERDTRPLIDHYRSRGLLAVVDAGGPVERVYSEFLRAATGA
jgi:adenylate kinase